MKTDLTPLAFPEQVLAVVEIITARARSGAKETTATDLMGRCKLRAEFSHNQRVAYFSKLIEFAGKVLRGEDLESVLLQAASKKFQQGESILWNGEPATYLKPIDAGQYAEIMTLGGEKLVHVGTIKRAPGGAL